MSQSHCLKELAIIAYWWLMTFITRELDIYCRSIDNSKHLCTSYETASVQRMRLSCFVKHLRNFGGTIFIWHHPLWISFKVHQRKSVSTFPMVTIWEALAPCSFTTLSVTFQPLSTAVVVNVRKPRTEAIPPRFSQCTLCGNAHM